MLLPKSRRPFSQTNKNSLRLYFSWSEQITMSTKAEIWLCDNFNVLDFHKQV